MKPCYIAWYQQPNLCPILMFPWNSQLYNAIICLFLLSTSCIWNPSVNPPPLKPCTFCNYHISGSFSFATSSSNSLQNFLNWRTKRKKKKISKFFHNFFISNTRWLDWDLYVSSDHQASIIGTLNLLSIPVFVLAMINCILPIVPTEFIRVDNKHIR